MCWIYFIIQTKEFSLQQLIITPGHLLGEEKFSSSHYPGKKKVFQAISILKMDAHSKPKEERRGKGRKSSKHKAHAQLYLKGENILTSTTTTPQMLPLQKPDLASHLKEVGAPAELTIVESLGTTQENNNTHAFASPDKLGKFKLEIATSPNQHQNTAAVLEEHSPLKKRKDMPIKLKKGQRQDMILEQTLTEESDADHGGRRNQSCLQDICEAASPAPEKMLAERDRSSEESQKLLTSQTERMISKNTHKKFSQSTNDLRASNVTKIDVEPLPIYEGEIRGYEPITRLDNQRLSMKRMMIIERKKQDDEQQRRQSAQISKVRHSTKRSLFRNQTEAKFNKSSKLRRELNERTPKSAKSQNQGEFDVVDDEDNRTFLFQKDCTHLEVKQGVCQVCKYEVPQYGTILDSGSVCNFFKVIFIDESKRIPATIEHTIVSEDQDSLDKGEKNLVQDQPESEPNSAQLPSSYKSLSVRNSRVTSLRPMSGAQVIYQTIYESFTPENTHQLREYMLYVILKNISRMRKSKLITEAVYNEFQLRSDLSQPEIQSAELSKHVKRQKKRKRVKSEMLTFNSMLESGNLDRVEAQNLSQTYIQRCQANKQPIVQKYNLYCKVDTNTKGHQQWFYFKVSNTRMAPQTKYQFSICNFTKPFSLFKQGMQIQMLSKRRQKEHLKKLEAEIAMFKEDDPEQAPLSADAKLLKERGIVREQWQQTGFKIEYVKSKLERGGWNVPGPANLDDEEDPYVDQDDLNEYVHRRNHGNSISYDSPPAQYRKRFFYQMNFEIEFPYANDTVYLAYCQPYPYSKIIAHMFELENRISELPGFKRETIEPDGQAKNDKYFRKKITRNSVVYDRQLLCKTICGLPVPKISITANSNTSRSSLQTSRRKTIFVTARVHPGETNASSVFEGFFNSLVENAENSPVLSNFVVRLVPCMNPDGVVCGNYRSSVAGVDLNRQWILPNRQLHPEVYFTKALMHHITKVESKKILIYCDIHCHSKKKNSFLYGCNTAAEGAAFSTWTQVRLLPRLLARRSEYIRLSSCRFSIEACKLGTARVVVWKEFKVMNSFTLENSFYGYEYGPETRVYTQADYLEIGLNFLQTLNDYRVCLEQIREEMVESKGWLKPIKLKQITGVPAAEKIARELREERILKKKQEFIKRYHTRMANQNGGKVFQVGPPSPDRSGQLSTTNRQSKGIIRSAQPSPKHKPNAQGQNNGPTQGKKMNNQFKGKSAGRDSLETSQERQGDQPKENTLHLKRCSRHSSANQSQESRFRNASRDGSVTAKPKLDASMNLLSDERHSIRGSQDAMLVSENDSQNQGRQTKEEILPTPPDQVSFQEQPIQSKATSQLDEDDYLDQEQDENERFKDWRQLFNEDELNEAYEQAILAQSNEETQQINIQTNGQQAEAPEQSNKQREKEESDASNSDDSASDDNLGQEDLYTKVYMQKTDTIKQQIKQASKAQSTFLREVKLLVKKKSTPGAESTDYIFDTIRNKANRDRARRSRAIEDPRGGQKVANYEYNVTTAGNSSAARKNLASEPPFLLTGVSIENLMMKTPVRKTPIPLTLRGMNNLKNPDSSIRVKQNKKREPTSKKSKDFNDAFQSIKIDIEDQRSRKQLNPVQLKPNLKRKIHNAVAQQQNEQLTRSDIMLGSHEFVSGRQDGKQQATRQLKEILLQQQMAQQQSEGEEGLKTETSKFTLNNLVEPYHDHGIALSKRSSFLASETTQEHQVLHATAEHELTKLILTSDSQVVIRRSTKTSRERIPDSKGKRQANLQQVDSKKKDYIFKIKSKSPQNTTMKSESIIGLKIEHFQNQAVNHSLEQMQLSQREDQSRFVGAQYRLPTDAIESQHEIRVRGQHALAGEQTPSIQLNTTSVASKSNFQHASKQLLSLPARYQQTQGHSLLKGGGMSQASLGTDSNRDMASYRRTEGFTPTLPALNAQSIDFSGNQQVSIKSSKLKPILASLESDRGLVGTQFKSTDRKLPQHKLGSKDRRSLDQRRKAHDGASGEIKLVNGAESIDISCDKRLEELNIVMNSNLSEQDHNPKKIGKPNYQRRHLLQRKRQQDNTDSNFETPSFKPNELELVRQQAMTLAQGNSTEKKNLQEYFQTLPRVSKFADSSAEEALRGELAAPQRRDTMKLIEPESGKMRPSYPNFIRASQESLLDQVRLSQGELPSLSHSPSKPQPNDRLKHQIKSSDENANLQIQSNPQIGKITIKSQKALISKSKQSQIQKKHDFQVIYDSPNNQRQQQQLRMNNQSERINVGNDNEELYLSTNRLGNGAPQRSDFNLRKESLFQQFVDDADYPGGQNYRLASDKSKSFATKLQGPPKISGHTIIEESKKRPINHKGKHQSLDYQARDHQSKHRSEQFQMYIQMNLPKLNNESLKESYTRQILQNQQKRRSVYVQGGAIPLARKHDRKFGNQQIDQELSFNTARIRLDDECYEGSYKALLKHEQRLAGAHQLSKSKQVRSNQDLMQDFALNRNQRLVGRAPKLSLDEAGRVLYEYQSSMRPPLNSCKDSREIYISKEENYSQSSHPRQADKQALALDGSFVVGYTRPHTKNLILDHGNSLPKIARTTDESRVGGGNLGSENTHSISTSIHNSSMIEPEASLHQSIQAGEGSFSPLGSDLNIPHKSHKNIKVLAAAGFINSVPQSVSPVRNAINQRHKGGNGLESMRMQVRQQPAPLSSIDSKDGLQKHRFKLNHLLASDAPPSMAGLILKQQQQTASNSNVFNSLESGSQHYTGAPGATNKNKQFVCNASSERLPMLSKNVTASQERINLHNNSADDPASQAGFQVRRISQAPSKKNFLHLNAAQKRQSSDYQTPQKLPQNPKMIIKGKNKKL